MIYGRLVHKNLTINTLAVITHRKMLLRKEQNINDSKKERKTKKNIDQTQKIFRFSLVARNSCSSTRIKNESYVYSKFMHYVYALKKTMRKSNFPINLFIVLMSHTDMLHSDADSF